MSLVSHSHAWLPNESTPPGEEPACLEAVLVRLSLVVRILNLRPPVNSAPEYSADLILRFLLFTD